MAGSGLVPGSLADRVTSDRDDGLNDFFPGRLPGRPCSAGLQDCGDSDAGAEVACWRDRHLRWWPGESLDAILTQRALSRLAPYSRRRSPGRACPAPRCPAAALGRAGDLDTRG